MAVEVEFRDGVQAVADHVYLLLRGIDTHSLTKEEAIRASETQMVKNYLNGAQRKLVAKHFRDHGR
jgi:ABC-type transporter Mla maintaining outer membrane lipid asymmetry ATPase subunit MlaF